MSDRVKRILERFSTATIRAAMAENPAVMTAAGWRSTPDGIAQTDMDDEGVVRLRESLKEIAMFPLLDTGMGLVSKIPAVQKFARAIARGIKRNSKEGRAIAENVKKALSKIDDLISKSDVADINPELRELLLDEGVPADVLTDSNLEKLTRGRLASLVNTADNAPSRFVIREGLIDGGGRTYDVIEPGFVQDNYHYPKNQVGYIQTEPSRYGDGPMVTYIENITRDMKTPAKGVSETAYNAVIQDKGSLVSGELLLSPEKTMKVLEKYPNKVHLGNYGRWDSWKSGETFNHPVYKLTEPTFQVPIKYGDVFSGEVIDDAGNFIVDYTGDALHSMGGMLLRRFDMGGSIDKDKLLRLAKRINETSSADFVKRLLDAKRKTLKNDDGTVSTHELGYVTEGNDAVVFPSVQSIGDSLARFPYPESYERAVERGDTVHMSIPDAELFTNGYKRVYPGFKQYGPGGWLKNRLLDKAASKAADFAGGLLTKDEVKTILEHPTDYAEYLGWDEDAINEKKRNFYRNTSPWGYDLLSAREAISGNKGQDYPLGTSLTVKMARDYLFAEYLGIPQKERKEPLAHKMFEPSPYKPSMGGDDENYIRFSTDYNRNKIVDIYNNLLSNVRYTPGSSKMKSGRNYMTSFGGSAYRIEPGKSGKNLAVSATGAYDFNIDPYAAALGQYTLGTGYDNNRGQYISVYDRWDLNPFQYSMYPLPKMLYKKFEALGDASGGFGQPVNFYDRIYLDDYYGVDSRPKSPGEFYGGYIVPAVVTADKADGGLLRRFDEGGDKDGLWYNPEFDLGEYGGTIDPAVVTASALPKSKRNKENEALAKAIIARVNQDEAAKARAEGAPMMGEAPLQSEDYLFGLAALGAKAPFAGTVSAVKEVAPLWGRAGLRMLKDLPAFELVDRLPTLFGGKRMTELGGDATQYIAEKVAEKPLSPTGTMLARLPGEFALGAVPGVAGDVLMRAGANAGLRVATTIDNAFRFNAGELGSVDSGLANDVFYTEPVFGHPTAPAEAILGESANSQNGLQIFNNKALRLLAENGNEAAAVVLASRPYEIESLGGGYMLKSLMRGNPLEKQISKQGTVNVNNIRALINKGSKVEQAVVDKVLASEEFAGKKAIDYNKFRKAVQDELITYKRTPDTRWEDYGMGRIGLSSEDSDFTMPLVEGPQREIMSDFIKDTGSEWRINYRNMHPVFVDSRNRVIPKSDVDKYYVKWLNEKGIDYVESSGTTPETYTFSSSRIPDGSSKHYDANTLGHSRTYTTADEPDVLHVMESQSDWAQSGVAKRLQGRYFDKDGNDVTDLVKESWTRHNYSGEQWSPAERFFGYDRRVQTFGETAAEQEEFDRLAEEWAKYNRMYPDGFHQDGTLATEFMPIRNRMKQIVGSQTMGKTRPSIHLEKVPSSAQEMYLSDNYTSRQIQENLRYAAEKGQTKMRYPTRETAAKIEGYNKSRNQALADNPKLQEKYDDLRSELAKAEDEIYKKYVPEGYIDPSMRDVDYGDFGIRMSDEDIQIRLAQERASEAFDKTPEHKKMVNEIIAVREKINPDRWLEENVPEVYLKEHETILKKYDAFPKQYQKLFKGADVRIVTDAKGNTWYEVDVPENYLQQEWAYADGGHLNRLDRGGLIERYGKDKILQTIAKMKQSK